MHLSLTNQLNSIPSYHSNFKVPLSLNLWRTKLTDFFSKKKRCGVFKTTSAPSFNKVFFFFGQFFLSQNTTITIVKQNSKNISVCSRCIMIKKKKKIDANVVKKKCPIQLFAICAFRSDQWLKENITKFFKIIFRHNYENDFWFAVS
jgi:hypothetical protein